MGRVIGAVEAKPNLAPGAVRVGLVHDRGRRVVRGAAVGEVRLALRCVDQLLVGLRHLPLTIRHAPMFRDRNRARLPRAHQRFVAVHVAHARRVGRREPAARPGQPVVQRGHAAAGERGRQSVRGHREAVPYGRERLPALGRLQNALMPMNNMTNKSEQA